MNLMNEVLQVALIEEDIQENGAGFKAEDLRQVIQCVTTLNEQQLSEPLEADDFLAQMRKEGLLPGGK